MLQQSHWMHRHTQLHGPALLWPFHAAIPSTLAPAEAPLSNSCVCDEQHSKCIFDFWHVQVPHVNGGSAIHVKCTWSNTGNTIQALSMDEDDDAEFTTDSIDDEDYDHVSISPFPAESDKMLSIALPHMPI